MVATRLMEGPCFAGDQAAAVLGPQRRVLEGGDKDRQREPQCGPLRAWRSPRHRPTRPRLKPRGPGAAETGTAPGARMSAPRPALSRLRPCSCVPVRSSDSSGSRGQGAKQCEMRFLPNSCSAARAVLPAGRGLWAAERGPRRLTPLTRLSGEAASRHRVGSWEQQVTIFNYQSNRPSSRFSS